MGDWTRHFSSVEFACPCCNKRAVSNDLVGALEELRCLVGKPILVTSGYRCERWNHLLGGARRSRHMEGEAADIVISGMEPEEMAAFAEEVELFHDGGIGVYPEKGFIHVDIRGKVARWTA